jgi:hypothetical protein
MSLKNRIIGLAAVGAAAALTVVPNAVAAPPAWTCDAPAEQIFAPWKDNAFYQLVDDGTFEQGAASWELQGGADVVQDNDAGLHADDQNALELGPGASATTPPICVTEDSESFRFLSNVVDEGSKDDSLLVEVLYLRKKTGEFKVKVKNRNSSPVAKLKLATGEFKKDSTVRLRFSSLNGATVRVDDVYMDPRLH